MDLLSDPMVNKTVEIVVLIVFVWWMDRKEKK